MRFPRVAGCTIPLFSIRTRRSWGVGEITDLADCAAWLRTGGLRLLQILPPYELAAGEASPYGARTAFGLDPIYIGLDAVEDLDADAIDRALGDEGKRELARLRAAPSVEYDAVRRLKARVLAVAFDRFRDREWAHETARARSFRAFVAAEAMWEDDLSLYVALRESHHEYGWGTWPDGERTRDPATLARAAHDHDARIFAHRYAQWIAHEQWARARAAMRVAGVELMGDLPFVVGLDSADVWANRELFHLDERLGTPPDEGAPQGQDWGLPVYDWDAMERDEYSWIRRRAKRAGELYGLYRVDHALGCYRTFSRSTDGRQSGFSPPEEQDQIQRGERLMRMMSRFGEVIAEDLGALPDYLRPSLERIGVAGYRVLRWEREGQGGQDFRDPGSWPEISVATNATHDTDTTADWYDALSPEDRERLRRIPALVGLDPAAPFGPDARDALLRALYAAPSTLTLVTLEDLLGGRGRINDPNTPEGNWTYRAPATIDELAADEELTARLATLASETGRAPAR